MSKFVLLATAGCSAILVTHAAQAQTVTSAAETAAALPGESADIVVYGSGKVRQEQTVTKAAPAKHGIMIDQEEPPKAVIAHSALVTGPWS